MSPSNHEDMAWRCEEDAEPITREIQAAGVTVENQAAAVRSHDLATAQKIIDRHPIMHGLGMAVEDVASARVRWLAILPTPFAAKRGGLLAA